MANPDRRNRPTDQRYPSNGTPTQLQLAATPRYPSNLSNRANQPGRYPSQIQVHPYARLPSHRDVSQPKNTGHSVTARAALQPTSAAQTVINAPQQPFHQGHSREISHVHNPGLEAAPVRMTDNADQQEREELHNLPHQTLHKPKSKLRLRLKLTPPHPPGTKLLIPSAPLPKHITKDDPTLLKVLTKIASNDRKGEDKENNSGGQHRREAIPRDEKRDSGMSFGNATKSSGFDDLDVGTTGQEYPPIHAQARAHQAYQRAQLGHGRAAVAPGETGGKRPDSQRPDLRYSSNSTNQERIKALEEAHLRRAAPEPPREPVFTLKRGQGETCNGTVINIPEGKFYQLDPTPVVSPIRVEGTGFQTITAATPRPTTSAVGRDSQEHLDLAGRSDERIASDSETTLDLSLTISRTRESVEEFREVGHETIAYADVSRFEIFYAESHGGPGQGQGLETTFRDSIEVIQPIQPIQHQIQVKEHVHTPAKRRDVETRNIDDVNDSSFDNSGDVSTSRDGNETGWTTTSGDDSGVVADREDDGARRSSRGKNDAGEQMNDVLSLSDRMLADRFEFIQEIGFGNWGSVWSVRPRKSEYHPFHRRQGDKFPPVEAAIRSQHHMEKVAVKLVHRKKEPTTAARVRALWSEMKVIRTLRLDPHPSIIGFDSFIITPSYAIVTMPFLSHLMPVGIPEETARSYFLQLTSAIAYLHDRGITHNDIKPANILLSHSDVPVLVDFGFAQRWDLTNTDGRGPTEVSGLAVSSDKSGSRQVPFWSEISWGTPEYLDPPRAIGQWHDERLSDVWALGITFFEILASRTPFEAHASEDFSTQEQLNVYYERTIRGEWLGDWQMSTSMERLLKAMICPDHHKRLTASQAHRHVALQPQYSAEQMSTPPFVRMATGQHDHRAKQRRKPQPKARPAKRDKSENVVLANANGFGSELGNAAHSPARNAPIRASDLLTPQKQKASEKILVVTPNRDPEESKALHAEPVLSSSGERSPPFAMDPEEPQEQPSGRSRNNAMSTIEALGRAGVPTESSTQERSAAEQKIKKVRSYDILRKQATVAGEEDSAVQQQTMRRPASAMALRSNDQHISESVGFETKQHNQVSTSAPGKRDRCVSQHRRHTRIVSEGCLRSLIDTPKVDLPSELDAQATGQNHKQEAETHSSGAKYQMPDTRQPAVNKFPQAVSNAAVKVQSSREILDSTGLDERLTEISSWVKSVEQIVLEARVALEEAQYPRSKTPVEFERSISRLSNLTNRRSVDNFVKLARDNQSAEHTGRPKTPSHRPSMSMETGPSYNLRRQRSDLTNFRSMQFQPIVEQELPESIPSAGLWSSSKAAIGLDRKLKSHRSTGDLNKMMSNRHDPYEEVLQAQSGVMRNQGEGWSSSRVKNKSGLSLFAHKDDVKNKQADAQHQSRFKSFFRGVFKR